ncbi:HAMP domain-containing sensor histidine kinase [Oscillibacter sp.]|uniref:sensor histidine kinase n=1 Tax=Oscillibacter sp. TaxID=1945593 RepID=UPI002617E60E|nr:HAMP domain-containing sensor histidine kinase [Oscillibacter sp.]MDD3347595.1 HAMP domain-containing sensor histidine kinase [Oscillibacter sp.]
MEPDQTNLASLFSGISAQLRGALSNLHLAAAQLIPAEAREKDSALDARAALLDQSYYRLLRLVNSLSAAASLSGGRPLTLQDWDIAELVSEQCERAASLAALCGLELRFLCPMEHHICAVDSEKLEQLLYHLLSNAFKFTSSGGTVTVELRRAQENILLSVADTGCGISEDRLSTLFDGCAHDEPMDAAPHGLGLGLYLCLQIAKGHDGRLMAESHLGKGSRFTFSFPDRQIGTSVSDIRMDYSGGFNRTLLFLADAMPANAFLLRNES